MAHTCGVSGTLCAALPVSTLSGPEQLQRHVSHLPAPFPSSSLHPTAAPLGRPPALEHHDGLHRCLQRRRRAATDPDH